MADTIISFNPNSSKADNDINKSFTKDTQREELFAKYREIDKNNKDLAEFNREFGPIGLEKIILMAQDGVIKFEKGMYDILYGKTDKYEPNKKFFNVLAYIKKEGISNVITDLSQVDYCDIINYSLSKVKIKNDFDPKNPPSDNQTYFKKQLWKIKKLSYDIQYTINLEDNDSINEVEKLKNVFDKIQKVNSLISEFKQYISPELNRLNVETGYSVSSVDLTQIFPQLKTILPSLEDKVAYLRQWTDYRQIPISEYQKIINTLDKINAVCVIIQGLTNPNELFGLFGNKANQRIQRTLEELQKKIDITKPIPLLRNIIKSIQKLNLVLRDILKVVNTLKSFTTILLLFIKIFKKILIFFNINPTPNLYTWLGFVSVVENGKTVVKDGVGKFEDRLTQINYLFGLISNVFSNLIVELELLIVKIKALIANLEECENVDRSIIQELKDELDETISLSNQINGFLKNKENADKNSPQNKIGEYTIQIVTEAVIDENFTLRRRYGVALNNRAQVTLSSTPTFASLDSIIIAEVKQLLFAKGLIKSAGQVNYSILEEQLINESKSYLDDDDINMEIDYGQDSLPEDAQIDPSDNENDDVGIGLNSFLNKLQGGKALRKRVRKARIKNNNELVESIKKDDPEGKYSKDIVRKTQQDTNKLKIEELKAEKNKWKAVLVASPSVAGKLLAVKKIKEIDQEIYKLKNS